MLRIASGMMAIALSIVVASSFPSQVHAEAGLPRFSERAFSQWQDNIRREDERRRKRLRRHRIEQDGLDSISVTGSRIVRTEVEGASPTLSLDREEGSITSNQVAGVDEGDIVKRRGDTLIVLRRGRLFSFRIGGDALRAVSAIPAYGGDIDGSGAWYDEMLVSDRTVVVIGYNYARTGTEIGLFDLSEDGALAYRSTWHLRGDDYYSTSNYASRLIGDTLVLYMPIRLFYGQSLDARLPALRRWSETSGDNPPFVPVLSPARMFVAPGALDARDVQQTLHAVVRCRIDRAKLDCAADAVVGGSNVVFHVAKNAIYLWTSVGPERWESRGGRAQRTTLIRMPMTDGDPAAIGVEGMPIDQLSFLERDDALHVVVSEQGFGLRMWAPRIPQGDLALLRVPLSAFGSGRRRASSEAYRPLLRMPDRHCVAHARFVGDWVLAGCESGDGSASTSHRLSVMRYASSMPPVDLPIEHAVERIEAMGAAAMVVGPRGQDLWMTRISLDRRASVGDHFVQAHAAQGESRSHGFFYRPESPGLGWLGLPLIESGGTGGGHPVDERASVLFLRERDARLSRAGTLASSAHYGNVDDHCLASCVDWYGDARPIFIGKRVFALMGYELVEGVYAGDRIVERRRVDFSPRVAIAR